MNNIIADSLKSIPISNRLILKFKKWKGDLPPRNELLLLLPQFSIGAEIGVHEGDFSEQILGISKPETLYLIDPWAYEDDDTYKQSYYGGEKGENQTHMDRRYNSVLRRFSKNIDAGQVCVLRDSSENALRNLKNDSLDWIYIDGNHLYEYVKQDLELAFLKVRPGGVISGDDYTTGGWWKGGVKQAVDEFVAEKKIDSLKLMDDQFLLLNSKK